MEYRSALAFLLIAGFGISGLAVSRTAFGAPTPSNQVCVPYPGNPVINDSQPYHTHLTIGGVTYNFTDFATTPEQPSVIKIGGSLVMFFGGIVNNVSGIFRAQSTDGISWTISSTPVLTHGAIRTWDGGNVYGPSVVYDGTRYLMYFSGVNSTIYTRAIGVAFSSNSYSWTEYSGNPIITRDNQTYDAWHTRFPSVVYDGKTYRMWFTAHAPIPSPGSFLSIGYATSSDGFHWTKYSRNPVLGGNSSFAEFPSVASFHGLFLMSYIGGNDTSYDGGISYATSPDGIRWTTSTLPLTFRGGPNSTAYWSALLVNGPQVLLWYNEETNVVANGTETFYSGIYLAFCSFALLPTTTTEVSTSVGTTTLTATAVRTETIFVKSNLTVTQTIRSSTSAYELLGTFGAGVATAAVVGALVVWRIVGPRKETVAGE